MEVKPGYKQTEVGVIPEEWEVDAIGDAFDISGGFSASRDQLSSNGHCYLHYGDIHKSAKSFVDVRSEYLDIPKLDVPLSRVPSKSLLADGDVVFVDASEDDEGTSKHLVIINPEAIPFISGLHTIAAKSKTSSFDNAYKRYSFQTRDLRRQFYFYAVGTKVSGISKTNIKKVFISRPPLPEQRAIAGALGEVDKLLVALEKLIAKKRDLKQAAMQQLLTGQTRLPGFSGEWEVKRIAKIATPSSERNAAGESLPVLTCSKHFGFMDSLGFFKNQVFSKDLSTYKMIRRGQIGYPANHVEEGSIGLQNLYDIALVSPIYVVFSVAEHIDSFFLHRLLKLDSYRQKFKTATTSSVERRGSLRWRAFSEITVRLPTLPEQTAIASVLSDMDAEIGGLEQRLAKTRALKQGMMQELLTGRVRLV